MKRVDLMRHVESQGCRLLREGAHHSVYFDPVARETSTPPGHREIDPFSARKICRDLQVAVPGI